MTAEIALLSGRSYLSRVPGWAAEGEEARKYSLYSSRREWFDTLPSEPTKHVVRSTGTMIVRHGFGSLGNLATQYAVGQVCDMIVRECEGRVMVAVDQRAQGIVALSNRRTFRASELGAPEFETLATLVSDGGHQPTTLVTAGFDGLNDAAHPSAFLTPFGECDVFYSRDIGDAAVMFDATKVAIYTLRPFRLVRVGDAYEIIGEFAVVAHYGCAARVERGVSTVQA